MQFGFKKGLISAAVVLLFRIVGPKISTIRDDSWTMMMGVIMLLAFVVIEDNKLRKEGKIDETAATNEFMRSLSFIPLIATTAITTGVYGIAGLTLGADSSGACRRKGRLCSNDALPVSKVSNETVRTS